MRKNTVLVITALALLLVMLVLSRSNVIEGFLASKDEVCTTLRTGIVDVTKQRDQGNTVLNDSTSQVKKIQDLLIEITKLSSSYDC
jgi:hypothetical protein